MAYYLQWSDDANDALAITGIVGTLAKVEIKVKSDAQVTVPYTRYLFDIRRSGATDTTDGGGASYLYQTANNAFTDTTGTSDYRINNAPVGVRDLFESYQSGDVLSFNVGLVPSFGAIVIGSRYNNTEAFRGLAIAEIIITDDDGSHIIDMSTSGGTGSSLTSTDGALTATLDDFATDDSQWIEYTPYTYNLEYRPVGGSATQVTGLTDTSYTVSGLNAGIDYEFRVQEVFDTTTSAWSAWSPFTTTTPILNIDGDDSVADGQTAVISFASGYDIGDATGTVELVTSDGATVETQTIVRWSNP